MPHFTQLYTRSREIKEIKKHGSRSQLILRVRSWQHGRDLFLLFSRAAGTSTKSGGPCSSLGVGEWGHCAIMHTTCKVRESRVIFKPRNIKSNTEKCTALRTQDNVTTRAQALRTQDYVTTRQEGSKQPRHKKETCHAGYCIPHVNGWQLNAFCCNESACQASPRPPPPRLCSPGRTIRNQKLAITRSFWGDIRSVKGGWKLGGSWGWTYRLAVTDSLKRKGVLVGC